MASKLLISSAAVVAIAAIFIVALPATTGIDPTGLGNKLSLTKTSPEELNEELQRGSKRKDVLQLTDKAPPTVDGEKDVYEVILAPYESVELKYTVPEGGKLAFSWVSTGNTKYDLHATPDDGGEELTEGYAVGTALRQSGLYTSQFDGIHGWYWQNRTVDNVTLRLEVSGAMKKSVVITDSSYEERPLTTE